MITPHLDTIVGVFQETPLISLRAPWTERAGKVYRVLHGQAEFPAVSEFQGRDQVSSGVRIRTYDTKRLMSASRVVPEVRVRLTGSPK